jgi:cytochrome c oxidase assembly protein subunit 15
MSTRIDSLSSLYDRQIAAWLIACAATIFGMILLGGITRLTDSGLSMVDWKPIAGIIPPFTQADWQEMFLKYQQFPEYQKTNFDMTLEEFKPIFMYEYLHRMLGRFIGILFVIPFLFFFISKRIRPGLTPKLLLLLSLGASQGPTWMVYGSKRFGRQSPCESIQAYSASWPGGLHLWNNFLDCYGFSIFTQV